MGGAKGHIVGFGADPKGTLKPPKGTVPFGKGLARTLIYATFSPFSQSKVALPMSPAGHKPAVLNFIYRCSGGVLV